MADTLPVSDLTHVKALAVFLEENPNALLDVPCDQELRFAKRRLPSGLYIYRIEAGKHVETGRMMRVR